jgi:hypothetical protein
MPGFKQQSHVLSRTYAHVARTSLLCVFVLTGATSCLITDTPSFEPPKRTRPQLLESTTPTSQVVKLVKGETGTIDPSPALFSADVISEDAGQNLQPVLLIDYGQGDGGDLSPPWKSFEVGNIVPAGTLQDGRREVGSIPWSQVGQREPGCHTVTMLITHEPKQKLPDFWCPKDADDFDTLTWFAVICTKDAMDEDDCDMSNCPLNDAQYEYCGDSTPEPTQ